MDGGLINNYSIKLFDREKYVSLNRKKTKYYEKYNRILRKIDQEKNLWVYNKETLRFRLDSTKEIAVFRNHKEPDYKKIEDLFDYVFLSYFYYT